MWASDLRRRCACDNLGPVIFARLAHILADAHRNTRMTLSSYANVFGLEPAPAAEPVLPGDLVRTGTNLFPHFEVIAVRGDSAWVQNVQTGTDQLVAVSRLRRISTPAADQLLAAE